MLMQKGKTDESMEAEEERAGQNVSVRSRKEHGLQKDRMLPDRRKMQKEKGVNEMIERQVIVTWYTPEEKLPKEGERVPCTISGFVGSWLFHRALVLGKYREDKGWEFDEAFTGEPNIARIRAITVHAWADLEPYSG